MKYITSFHPGRKLTDLILKQKGVKISSSGLHSTICFFYMNPKYEKSLICDLSEISYNPFKVQTTDFDIFDNNSFVIKLSRPEELMHLHNSIVSIVENYADNFDKIVDKYYGEKYNPHITLSHTPLKKSESLIGVKDKVNSYSLGKKKHGWKKIEEFKSSPLT